MKRPLLDRLYDIEHHFKLDGMKALSADVREAIERLQRLPAPDELSEQQLFAMWDAASPQVTKCSAMRAAYRALYDALSLAQPTA